VYTDTQTDTHTDTTTDRSTNLIISSNSLCSIGGDNYLKIGTLVNPAWRTLTRWCFAPFSIRVRSTPQTVGQTGKMRIAAYQNGCIISQVGLCIVSKYTFVVHLKASRTVLNLLYFTKVNNAQKNLRHELVGDPRVPSVREKTKETRRKEEFSAKNGRHCKRG